MEVDAQKREPARVILPCLSSLLEISSGAHDLRVEGLSFAYNGDASREYGVTPAQAGIASTTKSAITVQGALRILFKAVKVHPTSSYALWLDRAARESEISQRPIS
jgi:hypothetical protein